jgi:hypothetical protein
MKYYNGYGYNFYYGGYGYYEYSVNPPSRNGLALYVIIPAGICITCIFGCLLYYCIKSKKGRIERGSENSGNQ